MDKIKDTEILEIAKITLNFLSKNKILLIPENYEKWFNLFLELKMEGKDILRMTPLELIGLYKEKYPLDTPCEDSKKEEEIKFIGNREIKIVKERLKEIGEEIELVTTSMKENREVMEAKASESEEVKSSFIFEVARNLSELEQKLKFQEEKIKELEEEIEFTRRDAQVDALTGLYNRKTFDLTINDLFRKGICFSLILIDIDDFKNINDSYGHLFGDFVLKSFAETIRTYLRPDTPAFRVGGEEFAVILENCSLEVVTGVAERLRKVIENKVFRNDGIEIKLHATFGVTASQKGDTYSSLLKRADNALYKGKREGKNIVKVNL